MGSTFSKRIKTQESDYVQLLPPEEYELAVAYNAHPLEVSSMLILKRIQENTFIQIPYDAFQDVLQFACYPKKMTIDMNNTMFKTSISETGWMESAPNEDDVVLKNEKDIVLNPKGTSRIE
eukprot:PhF_6_TR12640/c0_g2_i2/m.20030